MGGLLHLVQRGGAWTGCGPAQSPLRCTKCNSPPINSQCIPTSYYSVWHYNCFCAKSAVLLCASADGGGCSEIDAVFLVDSSLSVRELCPMDADSPPADNWNLILNFVSEVVGAMPLDRGAARVGIATFSTTVSDVDVIGLGQWSATDASTLRRRILHLPFLGGNTNTTGALRFARSQLAGARAAAASAGTSRKQYVILLTDGANNVDADPVQEARLLKQDGSGDGVRLITVGISDYVDEAQLKEMASAPAEYSYIHARDFSHLNLLVGQLLDRLICSKPPPAQRKTTQIARVATLTIAYTTCPVNAAAN